MDLGDEHLVFGLPDGHLLFVEVGGFDPDPQWRHAGGAEDWVVSVGARCRNKCRGVGHLHMRWAEGLQADGVAARLGGVGAHLRTDVQADLLNNAYTRAH